MKINWKNRLTNKTTLAALAACTITFVYQVLGTVGITVPISEDMTTQFVSISFNILAALGVIVDPNSKGIGDDIETVVHSNENEN